TDVPYQPPLISTCTSYKPGSCGGSTTRHPDPSAASGTPPGSAPPAPAGPPPQPTGTSWAPGRPIGTNRTAPPGPALARPPSPAAGRTRAPPNRPSARPPAPPATPPPPPGGGAGSAPRPGSLSPSRVLTSPLAAWADPTGPCLSTPPRHSSSSSFRSAGIAE